MVLINVGCGAFRQNIKVKEILRAIHNMDWLGSLNGTEP